MNKAMLSQRQSEDLIRLFQNQWGSEDLISDLLHNLSPQPFLEAPHLARHHKVEMASRLRVYRSLLGGEVAV